MRVLFLSLVLIAGLPTICRGEPAPEPQPQKSLQAQSGDDEERCEPATGSRIRRASREGCATNDVDSISRDDIDNSGASSLSDAFRNRDPRLITTPRGGR